MPSVSTPTDPVNRKVRGEHSREARQYAIQAERLGQYTARQEDDNTGSTRAVEAKFVTPQDPVIETADGGRLPAVPLEEAVKLNKLKDTLEGRDLKANLPVKSGTREAKDGTVHGAGPSDVASSHQSSEPEASLRQAVPPTRTNPLFPPLPLYGPPTIMRSLQCWFFRTTSFFLSLCFLLVIVMGSVVTSVPLMYEHIRIRLTFKDPDARRPFHEEEKRRQRSRKEEAREWEKNKKSGTRSPASIERELKLGDDAEFVPTEGGNDLLIVDIGYYARRVGLDVEKFLVQTEDGFIIDLFHIYNPREYKPQPFRNRAPHGPSVFHTDSHDPRYGETEQAYPEGDKKYPILMMHGLLQSAGAYCCNDDDSLAFYLAKSGYDVWLGNNRCGFNPRHTRLSYADPRMWAWNIRQMGVLDLPALVSRVLAETGFEKLGLVAHSQGTTQTLVALAKEQRPDIGRRISVFCALAPAAYSGPLIGKAYFKFMRVIGPAMFRCVFGIHAFIPLMMAAHKVLPARLYAAMGYRVFSFLFNWSDTRWDINLRNRMFQFSPVFVSAESMRWWLGRECFARQRCILSTREEGWIEDQEDEEEDHVVRQYYEDGAQTDTEKRNPSTAYDNAGPKLEPHLPDHLNAEERGKYAWYDEQFPPLALWVAGADDLVDGRRLLRRFDRGREPFVKVVHKKIIEGYEHLDVIWAMDCVDKVGKEIKEVVWRTASEKERARCRTPTGCEDVTTGCEDVSFDTPNGGAETKVAHSKSNSARDVRGPVSPTRIDTASGEWSEALREHTKKEHIRAARERKDACT